MCIHWPSNGGITVIYLLRFIMNQKWSCNFGIFSTVLLFTATARYIQPKSNYSLQGELEVEATYSNWDNTLFIYHWKCFPPSSLLHFLCCLHWNPTVPTKSLLNGWFSATAIITTDFPVIVWKIHTFFSLSLILLSLFFCFFVLLWLLNKTVSVWENCSSEMEGS